VRLKKAGRRGMVRMGRIGRIPQDVGIKRKPHRLRFWVTILPDSRAKSLSGGWALFRIYTIQSRIYVGKGEHDRAIEDFDRTIKLDPHRAEFFYLRCPDRKPHRG